MRKINEIIIHCSGSDSKVYDFEAIHGDHTIERGWKDIGYHFGIDWNGNIHILRDITKPGAHCVGRNTFSIGVCILGNRSFSEERLASLGKLCEMLCLAFDLKKKDIQPHNIYNSSKTCPNFDVERFKIDYMRSL